MSSSDHGHGGRRLTPFEVEALLVFYNLHRSRWSPVALLPNKFDATEQSIADRFVRYGLAWARLRAGFGGKRHGFRVTGNFGRKLELAAADACQLEAEVNEALIDASPYEELSLTLAGEVVKHRLERVWPNAPFMPGSETRWSDDLDVPPPAVPTVLWILGERQAASLDLRFDWEAPPDAIGRAMRDDGERLLVESTVPVSDLPIDDEPMDPESPSDAHGGEHTPATAGVAENPPPLDLRDKKAADFIRSRAAAGSPCSLAEVAQHVGMKTDSFGKHVWRVKLKRHGFFAGARGGLLPPNKP